MTPGDRDQPPPPPANEPADNAATAPGSASETPREWWEEPGLPWKHKPTRADIACLSWMGVASVYGLILLPLRPVMLGLAPHLLGSLGYRTGLVMTGRLTEAALREIALVMAEELGHPSDWAERQVDAAARDPRILWRQ